MPVDDEAAPGWDAVEHWVSDHVTAEGEPLHFGTGLLPGQDGLYGLNAYRTPDAWLLVTLGLTELYGKDSERPDVSGWGFELTLRIPRDPGEGQPPAWSRNLLDRLGRYVFSAAAPFAAGHRLDTGEAITGQGDTRLTALAFTDDPDLPAVDTPNGRASFLRVVGITDAELEEMKGTSTAQVLARLADHDPLLTTNPER